MSNALVADLWESRVPFVWKHVEPEAGKTSSEHQQRGIDLRACPKTRKPQPTSSHKPKSTVAGHAHGLLGRASGSSDEGLASRPDLFFLWLLHRGVIGLFGVGGSLAPGASDPTASHLVR